MLLYITCHSPIRYFCFYFPRYLISRALLDPWMIRVTFWKKVQEFISFRPCERSHCAELPWDDRSTCSREAHPELCCTWHIPLQKIKLGSCSRTNWHVVLLPGWSCSSAVPNGTVQGHNAPHHPPGLEGVFLCWHYYSATRDFTPQRDAEPSDFNPEVFHERVMVCAVLLAL